MKIDIFTLIKIRIIMHRRVIVMFSDFFSSFSQQEDTRVVGMAYQVPYMKEPWHILMTRYRVRAGLRAAWALIRTLTLLTDPCQPRRTTAGVRSTTTPPHGVKLLVVNLRVISPYVTVRNKH